MLSSSYFVSLCADGYKVSFIDGDCTEMSDKMVGSFDS